MQSYYNLREQAAFCSDVCAISKIVNYVLVTALLSQILDVRLGLQGL